MHRGPTLIVALLVTLALIVAACGGEGGAKSKTASKAPPPVAPLTGLPDPNGEARNRPALEVKVDNGPDSRPQAGVDAADVVYEEVVEGEITRFLAGLQLDAP